MPVSINAKGAITGSYLDANNRGHGFVRQPWGTFVSFDVPDSIFTNPASINDAGAITGSYQTADRRLFGFVRDPHGKFTSFDPGLNTFPDSINDEGAITGYTTFSASNFFVRSPEGTITSFVPPFCQGSIRTNSISINDEGVITGWCFSVSLAQVGWVRFP